MDVMRAGNQESALPALRFSMPQHRRPCQIWGALSASSFRDGPKDQTSDAQLRIWESRHSGSGPSDHPGMTRATKHEARFREPRSSLCLARLSQIAAKALDALAGVLEIGGLGGVRNAERGAEPEC